MIATHAGEYLGAAPAGNEIGMRVMDWWRRKSELLYANWIFIDMPGVFFQVGIDLLDRLASFVGEA